MSPDIQKLLERQHDNLTREQLLALGVTGAAIKYRVRARRLFWVHPTVYSVGHPPRTPVERAAAAVLACGPTAVLSHTSALALWEIRKRWTRPFEVTVTKDRRPRGIKVHLSTSLHRHDITRQLGIRVTTPARALHDCAAQLTDAALARAVNDALISPYLTRSQLAEFLARHPNRRLQPFIETADGPTRSEFEDAFLAFCERYGLPRPRTNTIVAGREADAYFEAERLIVELDGWDYHSSRQSFEGDRNRDADSLLEGIATVRLTWDRMLHAPDEEAIRLHQILRRRRAV